MRSMTGFGQARGEDARHAVTVSLRAVNGRYLDLVLRLRDEHRGSEGALRELLTGELHRGRVEAAVEVRPLAAAPVTVEVRGEVVRALHDAGRELAREGLVAGGLTMGDLLRLPDAFTVQARDEPWAERGESLLLEVAGRALEQLVAARLLEGEKLAAAIDEHLTALAAAVRRLEELRGPALEEAASSLRRRLAELTAEHGLDETRLAQEVALLAERSDIREELDRLAAHLAHFREVMAEAGAIGKRLDFLTQEVFRELNTLGAKCRNAEVIRIVLDAKVLAEQIREQVQNVE